MESIYTQVPINRTTTVIIIIIIIILNYSCIIAIIP